MLVGMIVNTRASRRWPAAFLLGAALGCTWDDADNDGTPSSLLDAGLDATLVTPTDDAGSETPETFPCTSWTLPMFAACGGTHCQQTFEDLENTAEPVRACAKKEEAISFCSLKAPKALQECTVQSAVTGGSISACAAPKLPEYTAGCLDCFVRSAECAKTKCFSRCLNPDTADCDLCRVEQGCAKLFYDCSGFRDPLPE